MHTHRAVKTGPARLGQVKIALVTLQLTLINFLFTLLVHLCSLMIIYVYMYMKMYHMSEI